MTRKGPRTEGDTQGFPTAASSSAPQDAQLQYSHGCHSRKQPEVKKENVTSSKCPALSLCDFRGATGCRHNTGGCHLQTSALFGRARKHFLLSQLQHFMLPAATALISEPEPHFLVTSSRGDLPCALGARLGALPWARSPQSAWTHRSNPVQLSPRHLSILLAVSP